MKQPQYKGPEHFIHISVQPHQEANHIYVDSLKTNMREKKKTLAILFFRRAHQSDKKKKKVSCSLIPFGYNPTLNLSPLLTEDRHAMFPKKDCGGEKCRSEASWLIFRASPGHTKLRRDAKGLAIYSQWLQGSFSI